MSFAKPVVVIDNGSYYIKAGFACDNHPVSIFRTVVGRPSHLRGSYGRGYYDVHIGDDAMENLDGLELNSPVENGRIIHWDNMERVWHHVLYKELKVAPEDRSVILSCCATTPMDEKKKCCEIFLETLNSPGICILPTSVLSLYGSGLTTGLSVDLGHDSTDIVPIYEGGQISYAHMQTNIAGAQISNLIKDLFDKRNLDFGIKTNEIIDEIKKKHVYVSPNCAITKDKYKVQYNLPSGETIEIGEELFMAGEVFFKPELMNNENKEYLQLHDAVVTSVLKCDSELQNNIYDGIVVFGGMSTIPGIKKRLAIEVEEMITRPVNINDSSEALTVAWLGGAAFAGMPDATKMWISKKQFEEHGERIVRNRFM